MQLLFGSSNPGKFSEAEEVASANGFVLINPSSLGTPPVVAEPYDTYEENVVAKATAYCQWSGLPTIADDAGLEVDALGGAPGVISARYAGENASRQDNVKKLLAALQSKSNRAASFVSVVACVGLFQEPLIARGEFPGIITAEELSQGGFGYDGVFLPSGRTETLAALKEAGEAVTTHRVQALMRLFGLIRQGISAQK